MFNQLEFKDLVKKMRFFWNLTPEKNSLLKKKSPVVGTGLNQFKT